MELWLVFRKVFTTSKSSVIVASQWSKMHFFFPRRKFPSITYVEGGRKSAFVRARARNSKKSSLIVLERSLEKIDLESWSKNRACSRIFLREYLFLIKKRRKISSLLNYPRNFQLINYSSNLNSMNLDGSLLPTINNIFIRPRIVSIVTLIETRTIVSAIAERRGSRK